MIRRSRTYATLLAALVVVTASSIAVADSRGTIPESAAWGVVRSPNRGPDQNSLKGLALLADNDMWAVGEYNPGVPPTATGRRTLIEHWDGSRWRLVASPNPSWEGLDYATLEDVDGVAPNDVWAVGFSQDFASLRLNTLVEHWDGTSWRIVPSPNPAGQNSPNELYAVDAIASDDVWAVGERELENNALILHWDGSSWTEVPNGCGTYASLRGIHALSPTDIWAVGDATTCHYDGSTWTLVPSPQPQYPEFAYPLEAVSATAPDDIWAVGSRGVEDFWSYDYVGFAEHWDGTQWTRVYGLDGSQLFDVEALGPNDVWSVGTWNIIQHWNGQRWRTVPSPGGSATAWLRGLEPGVGASTLWAAGSWLNSSSQERTRILQAPSTTQGSVRGETGVAGAVVSWFGRVDGSTETNVGGRYQVAGLPAGTYLFTAAYGGCDPASAQVMVVAGTTVVQDLRPQC